MPVAAAPASSKRPGGGSADRNRSTLGWIAVWLVTLTGSFVAVLAGGEVVGSGVGGLGHVLQMVVVIGLAVLAVAKPWTSVIYALLGLFLFVRYFGIGGVILGGVPFIAAVLLYFGRPEPRQKVYRVMVGVPLLVALVTAGVVAALTIMGLLTHGE